MDGTRLRVGELSERTGLTVRTLHHYDELGLVRASQRTAAGHRLYSEADVTRLYQVVGLRRLGLSLADVAAVLDGDGSDPRPVVARQLARLDEQIELHGRLRQRLAAILEALDTGAHPTADDLIETMEMMTMYENYYTPEQLADLERRRQELGDDGMQRAQQEWADLLAAVEAERLAGTDPADPKVQALALKWNELIQAFTGGDPGIRQSLQNMYEAEGSQAASRGMVNPETMAYGMRAVEALTRNSE